VEDWKEGTGHAHKDQEVVDQEKEAGFLGKKMKKPKIKKNKKKGTDSDAVLVREKGGGREKGCHIGEKKVVAEGFLKLMEPQQIVHEKD